MPRETKFEVKGHAGLWSATEIADAVAAGEMSRRARLRPKDMPIWRPLESFPKVRSLLPSRRRDDRDQGKEPATEWHPQARRLVLASIAALVLGSLLFTSTYLVFVGSDRIARQGTRFTFVVVLCIFLYQRASWARWTTIVLYGVGGAVLLIQGIVLDLPSPFDLITPFIGVLYLGVAACLLTPSVSESFAKDAETALQGDTLEDESILSAKD